MPRYRFVTTIDCHLIDETMQTLRSFVVAVDADTLGAAREAVEAIAIEAIQDQGGDLTDAPVETIEIRQIKRLA